MKTNYKPVFEERTVEVEEKTYAEVKVGDEVIFHGYRWLVEEIRKELRPECGAPWGAEGTVPCTYFTLRLLAESADIKHTAYDGGDYGGLDTLKIGVVCK